MGHSRGTYSRSNNVIRLAQACAHEKKGRKALARRKKAILWTETSNTRTFVLFWSCVLLTFVWLCYACVYDL